MSDDENKGFSKRSKIILNVLGVLIFIGIFYYAISTAPGIPYGSEGYPDFEPPIYRDTACFYQIDCNCGEWQAILNCKGLDTEGIYWNESDGMWIRDDERVFYESACLRIDECCVNKTV